MPDVTVPVPDARLADFYQFFSRWLDGTLSLTTEPAAEETEGLGDERLPWTSDDHANAEWLWRKLNKRARSLFNLLMETPGREYTGHEIAKTLDIPNGANGVAGVLAWPGRYTWEIRRELPSSWRDGEDPGTPSVYWMTPETAQLFQDARNAVEQHS